MEPTTEPEPTDDEAAVQYADDQRTREAFEYIAKRDAALLERLADA